MVKRGGLARVSESPAATVAAVALVAKAMATPTSDTESAQAETDEPSISATRTSKTGLLGRVDLWQQQHRAAAIPVGVIRKFSDDRAGRLAALIAYYGFFSLFPAMLALVTILGFALERWPNERDRIASSALAQFPIIGDSIGEAVRSPLSGSAIALVIGLVAALWAGLNAMQAAQDAMNEVWDVRRADYPSFIGKRLRSLAMLALIGSLLIASTVLAQLAAIVPGVAGTIVLVLASAVFNAVAFLVAFRVLTVASITWRGVLPGAITASVGYTVLQLVGAAYVTHTVKGAEATYGTFALVIGLLSWIFLIAQIMMLAAEVNVVLAKQLWPRSLFAVPATASDRESAAAQVDEQAIDDSMVVDVEFADSSRS